MRILETMGVPPFVGFHYWFSLNSLVVMIDTMFHHSCLNFLVHVSAAAAPILALTKQLRLYILGEKQRLMQETSNNTPRKKVDI